MNTVNTERAARTTWAAHYATPDGFRFMPAEELVRFCGRRRGTLGRVLEVGCGNGANLWFLAQQSSLPVVGVDFCDEALRAAQVAIPDAHLIQASALDLPFNERSFDTVIDVMMGQHLSWQDHEHLFDEYRRVLTRGGTAFIYHLVHGTSGTIRGYYDYPDGISLFPDAGRVCLPVAEALTLRLGQRGFSHIERRGMDRTYPNGERACYAVIEGTT